MGKILDKLIDWIIVLANGKSTLSKKFSILLEGSRNRHIFLFILLAVPFSFLTHSLYEAHNNVLVALIPIFLLIAFALFLLVSKRLKRRLKEEKSSNQIKLVGFNYDFNENVLRRIYTSFTKYEYLDENKTRFSDFYNVFVEDFNKHDSVVYFNCTQPQLKYILEKFKYLKRGFHLTTFERSEKFYNKGKLIIADSLSKKYSEFPPTKEFEDLIDSMFDFLGEV